MLTFGAPCINPCYHGVWRPHEGHQTRPRYFPPVQTTRRSHPHWRHLFSRAIKTGTRRAESKSEHSTALFWGASGVWADRWFMTSNTNQSTAAGRRTKKLQTVKRRDHTFPCHLQNFYALFVKLGGRNSSVGIATLYELEGPGSETRWRWGSPRPSKTALGPTQPSIQWVPDFFSAGGGGGGVKAVV